MTTKNETTMNDFNATIGNTVLCNGFLIPMTDFVIEIDENKPKFKNFSSFSEINQYEINGYDKIRNYATFLKQPLKLEMFVPCDDEGNVLEYIPIHRFADNPEKYRRYKKAKENVLFELKIDSDYKFDISDYKFICNYYVNLENWLKDRDILYKIKLSQTALNAIFG
jgi:hypothetical protein